MKGEEMAHEELSDPGRLQPLGLVEVLDWTSCGRTRPRGP